ncbi:cytochrome b [Fulvimarina endophytica]|uniref:Cytochrome b n=1 Tax=Fulvimarina endophytica TaxID=2293836 RepID=A0A371WYJ4_9HYPH|nr:cytochrome b/b6 domain-containing protein [Fulvimarina endophytica]RFC62006.1 cytochrome b [Fulvimarina endophytica]
MSLDNSRTHWTRLNVFLHWTIVVLIIGQWIEGEFMVDFWDGTLEGHALDQLTVVLGYTHIVLGTLVLVAAAVRLLDRFVNGRPPHAEGEPTWALTLSKVTHVLLYAVLLVMPALGLAAWFTGNDDLAGYHTLLWNPLLALIGLHILGALAQHFWFKTGALKRMLPGIRHAS